MRTNVQQILALNVRKPRIHAAGCPIDEGLPLRDPWSLLLDTLVDPKPQTLNPQPAGSPE